VYIPYYVYYSPHQYITGEAAKYLTELIKRVKILKSRLHVFRHVIQRLLQKERITNALYQKTDAAVLKKLLRLELALKSRKLTLKQVNSQLELVLSILRKLGYNTHIPVNCNVVVKNGKKCRNGFVERVRGKKYVKNRVFTKIIVRKTKSRIVGVSKRKTSVRYVKKGAGIVRKTVRINPKLRKLVFNQAYAKVVQDAKVQKKLKEWMLKLSKNKSKRVRNGLKNKKATAELWKRYVKKHFAHKLGRECKKLLKSDYVRKLRKNQYKDVIKFKVTKGQVTKGVYSLPKNIIAQDSIKNLKKFLGSKHKVQ